MSTINLGKVVFTLNGTYSSGTTYSRLSAVRHNYATWGCIQDDTVGIEPTVANSEYWMLLNVDGNQVQIDDHIAGTDDRHDTDAIDNVSTVPDGTTGVLSGALDNLQSQVNAITVGGTEVDPRLSQALVDFEGTDWSGDTFKDLQDSWQERTTIVEDKVNTPEYMADIETYDEVTHLDDATATNGQISSKIDGLTLHNDMINGGFSDGTTGWTTGAGTISVASNILSATTNGTSTLQDVKQETNIDAETNDIWFL